MGTHSEETCKVLFDETTGPIIQPIVLFNFLLE